MEKLQAWQILVNVCEGISATKKDHQIIGEALMTLKPEPVEPVKE